MRGKKVMAQKLRRRRWWVPRPPGSCRSSSRQLSVRDRPDIHYAVKEICRRMVKPVKGDWEKLIRLVRYLKGASRCVQCYEWQGEGAALTCCRDSDWSGCRATGESTSGVLVQLGTHLLKTWTITQESVTLSSAEAELVALAGAKCCQGRRGWLRT